MSKRPVAPQFDISQNYYGVFSTQYSGGSYHGAIDYKTPRGSTVIAPDDGEIVYADRAWNLPGGPFDWESRWYQLKPAVGQLDAGGGIMTVLRNKNGWFWIFAHLDNNNMAPVGTIVKAGDKIAESGMTGNCTGPHLHMSLMPAIPDRDNGAYGAVDPQPYLDEPFVVNSAVPSKGPGKHVAEKNKGTKLYGITHRPTGFQVARSFYGYPAKPQGITLHHWGVDGQDHGDVERFLTDVTSPERLANPTSAHEVISDGRVTVLADPTVATYHAGSTAGNGKTIGLEVRPEMTAGDLDTLVQRIYEHECKWGSMPIYLHKDWFATACPGRYQKQLNKIVARVNAMHKNNGKDPQIATGSQVVTSPNSGKDWFEMATEAQLRKIVREEIRENVRHAKFVDINGKVQTFNQVWSFRTKKAENLLGAISKAVENSAIGRAVWGYKNRALNGDKDTYQLVTDINTNSAK